ncbi:MAG: DUF3823 domain-containing protein [Ilyomonas sp.]
MKFLSYLVAGFILTLSLASCKKDNYSPPNSEITGALLYNGDSIGVEYNQVTFQLYQYGFGKVAPIEGTFAQNGTLNALLFDGDYKFIIPNGQGPFMWKQTASGAPDSLDVKVSGSQSFNIEVTPYYMIRNAQVTGSSSQVTANFKVEKVVTDANAKDIERVTLYINNTYFVSGANNIAKTDLDGAAITDPNNISLNVAVPSLNQNYVFARIGLKIAGVEDMIFSPLVKVTF